ncbi:hypothetical protein [Brevibacillus porteri]|uniref:hypothetical protein n=1 Tax=Brevibacillus porteri TaxID=2126350 RepID=UPI001304CEF3|nr:hypothetical protein [Brevibacillus porteri]MED1799587.1 hypothetical protein [Brevibacillus porteri]MED2133027.1 hypothetical protein [Brevibacillus porteri]MED2748292.1 hypothetical protein [Brevibacillus porteri]MED2813920.1 hypothetical protein [Brevibacillus porteri]MED2893109.1 hypothetical protein [Brevibacillus porteri]
MLLLSLLLLGLIPVLVAAVVSSAKGENKVRKIILGFVFGYLTFYICSVIYIKWLY